MLNWTIHKGRIVDTTSIILKKNLQKVGITSILHLNGNLYPKFIIEFYKTFELVLVNDLWIIIFEINGRRVGASFRDFRTLLNIPFKGDCFYTNEWSLKSILKHNSNPTNDPLYTKLTHPTSIIYNITKKCLKDFKFAFEDPCNLFVEEICPYLKTAHLLIRENIMCTVDCDKDLLLSSEAYMLFCISSSTPFNFSHFIINRINDFKHWSNGILPYGLLLLKFLDKLTKFSPNNHKYISFLSKMNPISNILNEEIPEDMRCAHHDHHK